MNIPVSVMLHVYHEIVLSVTVIKIYLTLFWICANILVQDMEREVYCHIVDASRNQK